MHGPSATPLLVELATVAIVLAVALARRPLARLARAAVHPRAVGPQRRRLGGEPS